MMRPVLLALSVALLIPIASCAAQDRVAAPATTQAAVGRFPFLEVDARARQVRVECEALSVEAPLEFFCCLAGTTEHESVLRSKVRPSHFHAALLMLGLEPGEPVRFSEASKKWLPPHGPPLQISCEFDAKDGTRIRLPAYRLMRDFKTKREMPPMTWIFAGSRTMPTAGGDVYAADRTGYLVSVVNFDFTVIDIPDLASNANETLHWETNLPLAPPRGTKVTMIIEPAGKVQQAAAAAKTEAPAKAAIDVALIAIDADGKIAVDKQPVASADELAKLLKREDGGMRRARVAVANAIEENPAAREVINALSRAGVRFDVVPQAAAMAAAPTVKSTTAPASVAADEALIRRLREQWQKAVAPHDASLRQAATTHYEVITQLRREQQRLIDEADKVQRLIDELEKQYQDMTTPRPK